MKTRRSLKEIEDFIRSCSTGRRPHQRGFGKSRGQVHLDTGVIVADQNCRYSSPLRRDRIVSGAFAGQT